MGFNAKNIFSLRCNLLTYAVSDPEKKSLDEATYFTMIPWCLVLLISTDLVTIAGSSTASTTSNCIFDEEQADGLEIICDGITNIGPLIDEFVKVSLFSHSQSEIAN